MFLLLAFMEFIALPNRKDALLFGNQVITSASGSIGAYYDNNCFETYPNQTLLGDKKLDWCSNIGKTDREEDKPWISYSLENKAMKLTGFALRNGCCWYDCCCINNGERIEDLYCCCVLYSFALQGSNDNRTWKTIHKVEKDASFRVCEYKTYEFPLTEAFRLVRLILVEPYPKCRNCMQINQIELYGSTIESFSYSNGEINDNDEESVSIIGKVNRDAA